MVKKNTLVQKLQWITVSMSHSFNGNFVPI